MFPPNSKIMIADDSTSVRRLIRNYLLSLGYGDVIEAEDGEDAFDQLAKLGETDQLPNLIIGDWKMPKLDGMELLLKLKCDSKLAAIPMLMVTAESDARQFFKAFQAGVSDYVVKPFDEETLGLKMAAIWRRMKPA